MKIRMMLITEYEINPAFYPEHATTQQILNSDVMLVEDDEKNFFDLGDEIIVKGEIIE